MLDQEENQNWWSNSLPLFQRRHESTTIPQGKEVFYNLKDKGIKQKISLGRVSSQRLMNKWKPWVLMERLIGISIEKDIKRLSISIGANEEETNSLINLLAKLFQ